MPKIQQEKWWPILAVKLFKSLSGVVSELHDEFPIIQNILLLKLNIQTSHGKQKFYQLSI